MNYKPHILLVDAHSKGNGCNDDLNFIPHPLILNLLAPVVVQLCMIIITFHVVVFSQNFSKFLAILSRNAVNDAALAFKPSP